jgi:2-methylisocitrate lyase-like PEP mutase family enzyme
MEEAMSKASKYERFRELHEQDGIFIIPNPWDVGTARILASMGFEALAKSSAGFAFSLGVIDGAVSRERTLTHCRDMAAATVLVAAETGLAGCSIEDYTNRPDQPIYDFQLAVERIKAAAAAARSLPHDFILNARCENFIRGNPDLFATIERLQAFEEAGADVLYAPALPDLETIRTVCTSVGRPVNVLMGIPGSTYNVEELAEAGVRRISVGSCPARVALGPS